MNFSSPTVINILPFGLLISYWYTCSGGFFVCLLFLCIVGLLYIFLLGSSRHPSLLSHFVQEKFNFLSKKNNSNQ